jgi:hypothetical protein
MADEVNTAEIERAILRLLEERGEGKEIAGSEERSAWEPLMSPVRAVAGRLVEEGKIVVTQRGRVVDGATAKGAIRLRLR